ncbi:MAG: histidine phosphatase family protein [Ruminococcus sp.]|nr:histidine phosphatase family protein [Ruminococcus sp.]
MIISFIRHGKTKGNLEKRYIGRTDEPLSQIGRKELMKMQYPECDIVISSKMKRCIETAEIIYPKSKVVIVNGLEECDFGDFEGMNYLELSGNSDYQKWIDSGGILPFPNGENIDDFKKRCIESFEKAVTEYCDYKSITFVVHGGTIMSVLEKYAVPKRNYYNFQVKNGHGFLTVFDGEKIEILENI